MIYIVTGNINSGKTTRLLSLYEKQLKGDGFILPKIYIKGKYAGQQITRLLNRQSVSFSRKQGFIPENWVEKYCLDTYSFCTEGFDFAFEIIQEAIKNNSNPIYIDEIGPLELEEKGFYQFLPELLESDLTIIISVRRLLLKNILDRFKIKKFIIIEA